MAPGTKTTGSGKTAIRTTMSNPFGARAGKKAMKRAKEKAIGQ